MGRQGKASLEIARPKREDWPLERFGYAGMNCGVVEGWGGVVSSHDPCHGSRQVLEAVPSYCWSARLGFGFAHY